MSTVEQARSTRSGAPVPRERARLLPLLLLLLCVGLAIVAGVVASRLSTPGSPPAGAAPGSPSLRLPDGTVEVVAVTPELLAHAPGMPAAMMPGDPLPDDARRVTVQLVLTAGPDGLAFAGGDFRLGPPGAAGSAPERDHVGEGTLPPGYRMDGELVFRVPSSADALVLTETTTGRAVEVAVDGDAAPAHGSAHGTEPADGTESAEGTAPAGSSAGSESAATPSTAPSHQHG